ncbi:hypothetical protein GGI24_006448, partial [Coemansia furcata]
MYCRRCGEIVASEGNCKKCGGRAVESTTGAGAMNTTSAERKDPWTSKYLQRRLNPANVNKGGVGNVPVPRPISTALTSSFDSGYDFDLPRAPPQRPVTGSPGGGGRGGDDLLGLARPRLRDAGSRPSSMYAGGGGAAAVLEPPVMSAVQRTVAGQQQQTSPGGAAQRGLKSKWSQYFTSTAEAESPAPRTRSESLSAPAAAAATPKAQQRPAHSVGTTTMRQPAATAAAAAADPAPARMAGSAAAVRAVGAASNSGPAGERSRSATLPEQAGTRACTTCGRGLRVEEQRQFATQPGVVYCTACYHSSYSRGACAGCGKVVLTHGRPWAQYGDRVWHKLCIRCRACSRLLVAPLVADDGEPCCEPCLASAKGSRSEPPVPSAIGGSTARPLPPSPVSGRSSAAAEPRAYAEPR